MQTQKYFFYFELHPGCIPHHIEGTNRQNFPTGVLSAGIEPVGMILYNITFTVLKSFLILHCTMHIVKLCYYT